MSKSPKKMRPKLDENEALTNDLKRRNENDPSPSKRMRGDDIANEESQEKNLQAMRKNNFITACKRVSYQAYINLSSRFQLAYFPSCLKGPCNHHANKTGTSASQMPSHAEVSFKTEVKANMWHEALEVCTMCISPKHYLSANVLKDVVEIIMNAHDDTDSTYSTEDLIERSQQILGQNFSTHPPCLYESIRECYKNFLTSPLDRKANTSTNRPEFGYDKGIVKYCMNRLQYELSSESKDGPLVDKDSKIPLEMQQSLKGLHWQKENFEIFELLTRGERVERLMVVLESLIELLQFDLAIWHSKKYSKQGQRKYKTLMEHILWGDNKEWKSTGKVTSSCRQIMWLFVQFVHLGYPAKDIKIMTNWLNTMIQTFYICETHYFGDYPNDGNCCRAFAEDFYTIIAALPNAGIIKVLEAIQPTYMMHMVALWHLKQILDTKDDILGIIIEYVRKSRWKEFPESFTELNVIVIPSLQKRKNIKDKLKYLVRKCREFNEQVSMSAEVTYPKEDCMVVEETKPNQNHVIHIMLIVLQAYLDAYSVQNVKEKLESLNEQVYNNGEMEQDEAIFDGGYFVTEHFIKKYRTIYQTLQELRLLFEGMKNKGELPDLVKVFANVDLLGL